MSKRSLPSSRSSERFGAFLHWSSMPVEIAREHRSLERLLMTGDARRIRCNRGQTEERIALCSTVLASEEVDMQAWNVGVQSWLLTQKFWVRRLAFDRSILWWVRTAFRFWKRAREISSWNRLSGSSVLGGRGLSALPNQEPPDHPKESLSFRSLEVTYR